MNRGRRYAQGYSQRMLLLLAISVVVFAVDQISKVIASSVHPDHYVQNPSTDGVWWLPLCVAAVACTVPFRPFTVALALAVGGAAGNVFDVYFWPGGVPDFIYAPSIVENGIWNLADAFIVVGAVLSAGAVFVLWPMTIVLRRKRSARDAFVHDEPAGSASMRDQIPSQLT